MRASVTPTCALIVTDIQNDFLPGGALAVPRSDEVIAILNRYIERFQKAGAVVVATRDWHPPRHSSFQAQGGPWPPHCVQGSPGAQFHPALKLPKDVLLISKATRVDKEAYSSFQDTGLADQLAKRGIQTLYIGGLATDYCVKFSALDACRAGFTVFFLEDASRGIEAQVGDCERARYEIESSGARTICFKDLAP